MFRRSNPFFYAFDLLWLNGEDLRSLPLIDRKRRLRNLIGRREGSRLLYLDHIEARGAALFEKTFEFDFEGIVAKVEGGPLCRRQPPLKLGQDQESELQSGRGPRRTFRTSVIISPPWRPAPRRLASAPVIFTT